MDELIILQKLESLKRCIDRISSKIPATKAELASDFDLQDIIVINLERAVQQGVDIAAHVLAQLNGRPPQTMAESFERLRTAGVLRATTAERMQKAVGFRNLAVHEYEAIDWGIVYAILTLHLDDFKDFAKEIWTWLEGQKQDDNR